MPIATGIGLGVNTGYIDVPSNTYSIVALPAGTAPSGASVPLFTGSQMFYPAGSVRTILLIDQPPLTSTGLQIITADDFDPSAN